MKFVVVTGGVISGIGKGITASSVGRILKECNLRVTAIKIDPYLNIDAGTMSPYEHGEVFVLDDGGEVDLDLGNYERFLEVRLTKDHNITTGKIYKHVLDLERKGSYLGKTVQIIPHVTDAVKNWIIRVSQIAVDQSEKSPDICIIELGGTVGDIESMLFLEALRQLKFEVGSENFCLLHVSLIPALGVDGEMKTKPTQHSVKALREAGLIPDVIICRSSQPISIAVRKKISLFSMVPPDHVLSVHDVPNIYAVPRLLLQQNVCTLILKTLHVDATPPLQIQSFDLLDFKIQNCKKEVSIGIVGKYTGLSDSYISLTKALTTAALECDMKLTLVWIESINLEPLPTFSTNETETETETDSSDKVNAQNGGCKDKETKTDDNERENKNNDDKDEQLQKYKKAWQNLESVDGILIPGGFGDRGIEGKILAIEYARIHKKPFLGICLGMQCAVIEYARNICKLKKANSAEFDPVTEHNVVICMPDSSSSHLGGTMRLGSKICHLQPDSIAYQCYQSTKISERHRHRYEVNPKYVKELESQGLLITGKDESGERMEIVELPTDKHPFYFACQFHPEFKSGPTRNSPPFLAFVQASIKASRKEVPRKNQVQIEMNGNNEKTCNSIKT